LNIYRITVFSDRGLSITAPLTIDMYLLMSGKPGPKTNHTLHINMFF
jgi:hypothetical protein